MILDLKKGSDHRILLGNCFAKLPKMTKKTARNHSTTLHLQLPPGKGVSFFQPPFLTSHHPTKTSIFFWAFPFFLKLMCLETFIANPWKKRGCSLEISTKFWKFPEFFGASSTPSDLNPRDGGANIVETWIHAFPPKDIQQNTSMNLNTQTHMSHGKMYNLRMFRYQQNKWSWISSYRFTCDKNHHPRESQHNLQTNRPVNHFSNNGIPSLCKEGRTVLSFCFHVHISNDGPRLDRYVSASALSWGRIYLHWNYLDPPLWDMFFEKYTHHFLKINKEFKQKTIGTWKTPSPTFRLPSEKPTI